jgi:hypothetical protein
MNKDRLRELIKRSLRGQGFRLKNGLVLPPQDMGKENLRQLHAHAVEHRIEKAKPRLIGYENELIDYFASGSEVDPEAISPRLVEVTRDSIEELLFRYISLHWSIPVSSGYGRRLRFLVIDQSNQKVMGAIGIGDPVYSMGSRDSWIAWDAATRRSRLQHVMDAFVLGAVPPYSQLLGGKLVAMLAASDEIRQAFKRKYGESQSRIRRKRLDGRLALITTTSALGRSSIYNRLKIQDRFIFEPIGFTRGSGDFHFANGLYREISAYATRYCQPSSKKARWGGGFRNRREVVKKCLVKIGLSTEMVYHGIQREVFAVPLASNVREFLRGEHSRLQWYGYSTDELFQHFRSRWLLPRSKTNDSYKHWDKANWRIWPSVKKKAK